MRILIAEDDATSRRYLKKLLERWGYEVNTAVDGTEAWVALRAENPPRLAILDWMMPGKDGLQLCAEIRRIKDSPYTYIILLTARHEKADIVRGLDAGADDYITKPFDPSELRARLRAGRRILALQEALISARDALRFHATIDPLTGVWNRAAAVATLRRELARSDREHTSLAVFLTDLDHFARLNETYGHVTGDAVLREAAQRVLSVSRMYDSIGRMGGEEFLVIVPGCEAARASEHAERLRAAIGAKPFDLPEGLVQITASASALTIEGRDTPDASAVVAALNVALARAKSAGRDRIELTCPADFETLATDDRAA